MTCKKKKHKRHIVMLMLVIMSICAVSMGAVFDVAGKDITFIEINEFENLHLKKNIKTRSQNIQSFLDHNKISVGDYDTLNLSPDTILSNDTEIILRRGIPITIITADATLTTSVTKAKASDALLEAGIVLNENDQMSLSPDDRLTANDNITITNISETDIKQTETIPRQIQYQDDPSLLKGETKVISEGCDGILEITERVVYRNGEEISRTEISRVVIQEAQDKIIANGTMNPTPKPTATPKAEKSTSVKSSSKTATPVKAEEADGTIAGYKYTKKMTMNSTAYSAFTPSGKIGTTASGIPSRYGVVAVDPKVIPLGTKLYVEGYGVAIAADTGGAIKGNKIDLCFEDTEKNLNAYGRKNIDVYILE